MEKHSSTIGLWANLLTIISIVGAGMYAIYDGYQKLSIGQRTLTNYVIESVGFLVVLIALLYVSFSGKLIKKEAETPSRGGKRSKKIKVEIYQFKYSFTTRVFTKSLLTLIVISVTIGGYFQFQDQQEWNRKVVILVANISGEENTYRVTENILLSLNNNLSDAADFVVLPLREEISEQQGSDHARKLGKEYHADLVVWGWYGATNSNALVYVNIENLDIMQFDGRVNTSETINKNADISEFSTFTLQQEIGSETTALALFLGGIAQTRAQNFPAALELLNKVEEQPNWADEIVGKEMFYYYRGGVNYEVGNIDQSFADYSKAVEINYSFPDGHSGLGGIYYVKDEYEKALSELNIAIGLDQPAPGTYDSRAKVYVAMNKPLLAIDDFTKVIELEPEYAEKFGYKAEQVEGYINAFFWRGSLYGIVGEYDKSIEDLLFYTKLHPNDADGYLYLGIAYGNSGQIKKGISNIEKSIDIDPNSSKAYYNLGVMYYNQKKYVDAQENLNIALSLAKDDDTKKEITDLISKIP